MFFWVGTSLPPRTHESGALVDLVLVTTNFVRTRVVHGGKWANAP